MNNEDIRSYNILKRLKVINFMKKLIIIKDSGIKGLVKIKKEKKLKENLNSKIKINWEFGKIDVVLEKKSFYEKVSKELKDYKINYFIIDGAESKDYQSLTRLNFNALFTNRAFILITSKRKNMSDFYYGINFLISENINELLKNKLNTIEGLKLLANYNNKNNVSVKTSTFFDSYGSNYYSGGAERYLIDLYEIFKEMNLNMDIYQNAAKPYFRKYNNINVIGLAPIGYKQACNLDFQEKQTRNYTYETKTKSLLHIYSSFQECYPNHVGPSIGISHGISWDNKSNKYVDGIDFWNSNISYIEGAKLCDKLVSVDTNTANWFQTIDYNLGNKKFSVIPNYVDTKEFSPRKDYLKKRDKIIITYPRRLYEPRGLYITLGIVDEILKKYDNVEFHFVGKGFKKDTDVIDKKIKEYPGRIFRYSKSPFEMHEVYKKSDISLIPTQYSEGTSLSCLEALASGNIVVATRIGGLTDLILNGYNGYLIEPDSASLLGTIENIIDNYDNHIKMKERAIESAKAFNKDVWKEKWKRTINSFNIKEKSKTIDLVEFYIKDARNIKQEIINKIKEELINENLVYIKSEKEIKEDNISGNLIQLIPFNEEVVSKPKKIYVETGVSKEISNCERI